MVDNEQFAKAFRIETARARDFQSIASVAFLIAKAPSQIMPTVASLEKWLNTEAAVDDNIKEDILESFAKFISLVLNAKLSEPIKRGRLSPAEFIMICYFMSLIRRSCTDEEISKAIGGLRDDVRRNHDDIRTNSRVFKTMFTFVNNFRNSLVGKTTTGQRAKRKRDSTEDIGTGRKLAAQAGTPQKTLPTKPIPPSSTLSRQRTSRTSITIPTAAPTPSASSHGPVVPQRPALPQKPEPSGLPPVNTVSNRPTHFDPLAVVEAAKLQAGQYNRSGRPRSHGTCFDLSDLRAVPSGVTVSPVNTQFNLNMIRNPPIPQPVSSLTTKLGPPPPPLNRPPYQPPPPPLPHNPNQYSPYPGYPGVVRQSPQLPPSTPTRDPRRPQQGGGWRQ